MSIWKKIIGIFVKTIKEDVAPAVIETLHEEQKKKVKTALKKRSEKTTRVKKVKNENTQ